jgi:hypothetical protein
MRKTPVSSVTTDIESIRTRIQSEQRKRDRQVRRERAAMLRRAIPTAQDRMAAAERAMASAVALMRAESFELPIDEGAIVGAIEEHVLGAAHEFYWLWFHAEKLLRGKRCPTTDESEEIDRLLAEE